MDFMDKAAAFLEEVNKAGLSFSEVDGDTAVVCEDCVAVISKHGDEVGVNFVNRVEKLPGYKVGFTREDYENFMIVEELTGGGEDAGN